MKTGFARSWPVLCFECKLDLFVFSGRTPGWSEKPKFIATAFLAWRQAQHNILCWVSPFQYSLPIRRVFWWMRGSSCLDIFATRWSWSDKILYIVISQGLDWGEWGLWRMTKSKTNGGRRALWRRPYTFRFGEVLQITSIADVSKHMTSTNPCWRRLGFAFSHFSYINRGWISVLLLPEYINSPFSASVLVWPGSTPMWQR